MRKLLFGLTAALCVGVVLAQEPPKPATPPAAPPTGTPAPTPAAPPTAAPTTAFYPLKKGTKWTYKVGEATVDVKVGDTTNGETKLETLSNNKVVASETISVKADGIYRIKINNTAITPPVKILALKDGKPDAEGAKWPVDSTVANATIKGEFTIGKPSDLKVGGVDYKGATFVDGPKFQIANTETAVKYWFVEGKGIVKLEYIISGNAATLELSAFEEGK